MLYLFHNTVAKTYGFGLIKPKRLIKTLSYLI